MKRPAPISLAAALLLAGCGWSGSEDQVVVSVIGREARLRDPAAGLPRRADAALLGAMAQGLVRLDAGGQVEPGLAIRWAISDDGLYYTFRLDHDRADADTVAAHLRRQMKRYRDGSLGTELDAVNEVVAVTPEVIEIRLSAPRPELMTLLAGPAFTLLFDGQGRGPLLIDGKVGQLIRLRLPPVANDSDDDRAKAQAKRRVLLGGERVGLAVARYVAGEAGLVTGGGYDDFVYTRLANISAREVQIDPATGLFGFRMARDTPALMAVEVRQALSMALDRDAIGTTLGVPGWRPSQAILPPGLTDIAEPTRPFWAQAIDNVRGTESRAYASRVETARRIIGIWRAQNGIDGRIRLSLAMPEGPGSAILFGEVRRQWRAIGVEAIRVGPRDDADLRLIDAVAPANQADWFLAHFLCVSGPPCSAEADQAYHLARSTTDPAQHARMIAQTEQRLSAIAPFIPIAQPVRWSLAAPDLTGFQLNARAVHPLMPLIGNQSDR